jgi:hypothetical protein
MGGEGGVQTIWFSLTQECKPFKGGLNGFQDIRMSLIVSSPDPLGRWL